MGYCKRGLNSSYQEGMSMKMGIYIGRAWCVRPRRPMRFLPMKDPRVRQNPAYLSDNIVASGYQTGQSQYDNSGGDWGFVYHGFALSPRNVQPD